MKNKTNKKRSRRIKRYKFSKRNQKYKFSRRNKFSKRSKRQRGGNYNAEQIQQIRDTIRGNNNLIDITDEEITQFINKINPKASLFANVSRYYYHSKFPQFLSHIMDIETREELQEFGDEIENVGVGADNTDIESDDSDI